MLGFTFYLANLYTQELIKSAICEGGKQQTTEVTLSRWKKMLEITATMALVNPNKSMSIYSHGIFVAVIS